MPPYFDQGFVVREPAWHGLATVLADYPGREEAMRIAGHDFDIVEHNVATYHHGGIRQLGGYMALVRSDTEAVMTVARTTYGVVQNSVCWDLVDAIIDVPGVQYETGITLKGGALCAITAVLDEPTLIQGDDSPILPYLAVTWTHDGSGAISGRATNVRVVCANTVAAAEAQGRRLGTDFSFRHSKNVLDRVAEAKDAVKGLRIAHQEYIEISNELAALSVTPEQREWFIDATIPMPSTTIITDRVVRNIDVARAAMRSLFDGPTIPDAHRFTAYGMHLAGVEYLDHVRPSRSVETLVGRSILRHDSAKARILGNIREVVRA